MIICWWFSNLRYCFVVEESKGTARSLKQESPVKPPQANRKESTTHTYQQIYVASATWTTGMLIRDFSGCSKLYCFPYSFGSFESPIKINKGFFTSEKVRIRHRYVASHENTLATNWAIWATWAVIALKFSWQLMTNEIRLKGHKIYKKKKK